jgi:hypothetical protein
MSTGYYRRHHDFSQDLSGNKKRLSSALSLGPTQKLLVLSSWSREGEHVLIAGGSLESLI